MMSFIRANRRRIAGVTIGLLVGLTAFFVGPRDLFDDAGVAAGPVLRETGVAQVSTLSTDHDAEGTLGFVSSATAYITAPPGELITVGSGRTASTSVVPASMVVTEHVDAGALVASGDVLWRLGNEPTVALAGAVPAYRDLADGEVGADVRQLEQALVDLGYDPDGTVTVDETFTATTEAMVERWQEDLGADVDGIVHLGSVVFIGDNSRVGETTFSVGDTAIAGMVAFDLLALDTEVTFIVSAANRDAIAVGDRVDVRLDGSTLTATVGSTTVTDDGGSTVVAALDEPVDLRADSVPVDVSWSIDVAVDVLTVPASAVIRTDDGSYRVERRDEAGGETWVTVEIGRSSNGRVEVSGQLAVGDEVVAP